MQNACTVFEEGYKRRRVLDLLVRMYKLRRVLNKLVKGTYERTTLTFTQKALPAILIMPFEYPIKSSIVCLLYCYTRRRSYTTQKASPAVLIMPFKCSESRAFL